MSESNRRGRLWNRRRPPPLVLSSSRDTQSGGGSTHVREPRCPRHSDYVWLSDSLDDSASSTKHRDSPEAAKGSQETTRPAAESQRDGGQTEGPETAARKDESNETQPPARGLCNALHRELFQQVLFVHNYAQRATSSANTGNQNPHPEDSQRRIWALLCPALRQLAQYRAETCRFFYGGAAAPGAPVIPYPNQPGAPEGQHCLSAILSPRSAAPQPLDHHAISARAKALLEDRELSLVGATLSQLAMVSTAKQNYITMALLKTFGLQDDYLEGRDTRTDGHATLSGFEEAFSRLFVSPLNSERLDGGGPNE